MKKLKLNKQTISILGNEVQRKIAGGENATGAIICVNSTAPTSCAPGSKVLTCGNYSEGKISCFVGDCERTTNNFSITVCL